MTSETARVHSHSPVGESSFEDGRDAAEQAGMELGNDAYAGYRVGQLLGDTHMQGKDARKPYPRAGDPELAEDQRLQRGMY